MESINQDHANSENVEAHATDNNQKVQQHLSPADNVLVHEKKKDIAGISQDLKNLSDKKASVMDEDQLVIFTIGNEEFGVNINQVLEITKFLDITRVPNSQNYIEGVINLRGRIHVVINLSKKLNMAAEKKADDKTRIIIIELNENRIGMIVDSVSEVLRVNQADIKPAPEYIYQKLHSDYVSGVAILGQRLIILLDLKKVLGVNDIDAIEIAKKSQM